MEHTVALLFPKGTIEFFNLNHKQIHTFFNNQKYQFCGAICDLNVVALCLENSYGTDPINVFSTKYTQYFDECAGNILVVGSDSDGEACDVDMKKLASYLSLTLTNESRSDTFT